MGSLASRPSIPAPQPQVVFIPAPSATAAPQTLPGGGASTPSAGSGGAAEDSGSPTASERRTSSLLQRGRGRFGTIQTGFRGLLSAASAAGQRKTLLGE